MRAFRVAGLDLAPAFILVVGFILLGWILPLVGGPKVLELVQVPYPWASLLSWTALAVVIWGALFVYERTHALVRKARSPELPLSPLRSAAVRFGIRRSHRVLAATGGAVLINYFMPAFLGFKSAIPRFQPFDFWDRVFIRLDQTLHGGLHPWELLHPVLANPSVTVFLDWLYYFWFHVSVFGFLILVVWSVGPRRGQFLLAFAATWVILGIGLATMMASVGPCYVGLLDGMSDPYGDLMAYLHAVHETRPLKSIQVQELLWAAYESDARTLTSGIAAMPSLHVAIPALFAMAAWRINRWGSGLLWLFTFLIFLGSVHLGWHYAVDGYVAVLAVAPVWFGCGWVAHRWNFWTQGTSSGGDSPNRNDEEG